MTQGFQGLASLLGQLGQQAPSIFNSLNAGQTASNPYLQNYNRVQQQPMQQQPMQQQILGGFMPQQQEEIPIESFMPYQQEGGFNMNSLFNRNRQMSGGQEVNPFNNIILG